MNGWMDGRSKKRQKNEINGSDGREERKEMRREREAIERPNEHEIAWFGDGKCVLLFPRTRRFPGSPFMGYRVASRCNAICPLAMYPLCSFENKRDIRVL